MVNNVIISLQNNLNVILNVLNSRVLAIGPVLKDVEKRNDNNDIVELNYSKDFSIKINSEIQIGKNQMFKISKIACLKDTDGNEMYYLYTHILNKSSMFILPLLANGYVRANLRWHNAPNSNFCNCFIGTEENGDYGNNIYLLYRFDGSKDFISFENFIKSLPGYIGTIDYDAYHVLYKFEIPELFKSDFNKIISGKYSEISDIVKTIILNFHNVTKDSVIGQIIYKDNRRKLELEEKLETSISKNAELYDPFEPDNEIYLNKYKIKTNNIYESGNSFKGFC